MVKAGRKGPVWSQAVNVVKRKAIVPRRVDLRQCGSTAMVHRTRQLPTRSVALPLPAVANL